MDPVDGGGVVVVVAAAVDFLLVIVARMIRIEMSASVVAHIFQLVDYCYYRCLTIYLIYI